jgi:TetR/AcrR family transcriptional regulator
MATKNATEKKKTVRKPIAERRQEVLETLIRLLNSENGMNRVTTERLAAEVGVSEGALYRYFPDGKTKMFEALIEQTEQTLQNYIAASRRQNSTADTIKAIVFTVIEFARKNPGVTRILTGHALMFEDDLLKARVAKFFDMLEVQFFNVLQLNKIKAQRQSTFDEREFAAYLVNFCEGQFLNLVRSNFREIAHQQFDKQWQFIAPLLQEA